MQQHQDSQEVYLTVIPNSGHRIGHKLDDLITGFILAEWYNVKYLHSPLPEQKWEDFFGFGEGEVQFSQCFKQDSPIISCTPFLGVRCLSPRQRFLLRYIEWTEYRARFLLKRVPVKQVRQWRSPNFWDGSPLSYFQQVFQHRTANKSAIFCFQRGIRVMLYQVHDWGKKDHIDPEIYSKVVNKLRCKYFSKKHPKKFSYFEPNVINIAVHVRRDDASAENQRFLPLSYYEKVLSNLKHVFQDRSYTFHVYSSGTEEDMRQVKDSISQVSDRVVYHLNEPAMEAIHHMAIADILVVGNSSFSHWPGFLSYGIKLYQPHFHMFDLDEKEWVVVNQDGDFDLAHFESLFYALPKHAQASQS
ncbi:MAG: hypothetical protein F6K04_25250 [Leptolyngbya sp. SIO4C5]|nr:hypothetical protein [Leptolyngbya sp. SIO4C5]